MNDPRSPATLSAYPAAEDGLRAFEHKARIGIWSLQARTRTVSWSEGIYRLLGHALSEPVSLAQSLAAFVPESRERLRKALDNSLAHGVGFELELSVVDAEGVERVLLVLADATFEAGEVSGLTGLFVDIDAQRRAHDRLLTRLAEEEAELRLAHRLARLGSWRWDFSSAEQEWSPEAFHIFGRSQEGPTPDIRWRHKLYTPDSVRRLDAAIRCASRDGTPYDLELEVPDGSGPSRWIAARGEPVRDERGTIIGLRGTVQDITERRRMALQLAFSEEQFRTAMEQAPIGMALVSLEGRFIEVNSALCRIVGYAPEALVALTFQEITYPEDLDADLDSVRELLEGRRTSYRMEKRYIRQDGDIVWVQLTGSLLRTDTGVPRHFIAQIEDITERRRGRQRLEDLSRRHTLALKSGDLGVWEWSLDASTLLWDEQMYEIYGMRSGVALHLDDWRNAVVPEDLAEAEAALRRGIDERTETRFSFRIRHPLRGLRYIEASQIPVLDASGMPISVVGVNRDVTETRLAQSRLRSSEERLRLMMDAAQDYALFMLDPEGRVVSWNRGAQRLFGYTETQILGQPYDGLFSADARAAGAPLAALQQTLEHGRADMEGWRQRADGRAIWASSVMTTVRDEQGRLVGYSKLTRDLTAQRATEQQLADAHRLREAIVEAAPLAIIATDPDGTIRSLNSAAEQMLGYRRDQLVGQHTPVIFHDPDELREIAAEVSATGLARHDPGFGVLAQLAERPETGSREWKYRRRDGTRLSVNLTLTPIRGRDESITGYLGLAYDITERKRREEYTRYIAHHDALTGLPNRVLLGDRLDQALRRARRSGDHVGVMMIDLDHFKRVNDSLGHQVGDELLKVVAERLRTCVREADTVARMGGDEFVVLMPDLKDDPSVRRVAEAVLSRISRPITVGQHELNVTPSIGLCIYPVDGPNAGVLLKNADAAMYKAKDNGRACIQHFDSDLELSVIRRMEIESDLRRALDRKEFTLHYQPQVSMVSGRITGVEALLRWHHPRQGWISPAEFVPIAEDTGLIVPIGAWVMKEACREVLALQARLGVSLRLGVNLSPRQFQPGTLLALLRETFDETGFEPRQLELEITEGVLLGSLEGAERTLEEVSALGVAVAVDDFGTGYSSLSYITRFPITTLKIDRAFVNKAPDSPRDAAVVQAILAMARGLDIQVVAEGVEDQRQLEFLRNHTGGGARGSIALPADRLSLQGFYFSKGLPTDALFDAFSGIESAAGCALFGASQPAIAAAVST